MTNTQQEIRPTPEHSTHSHSETVLSAQTYRCSRLQYGLCLTVVSLVFIYLLWMPKSHVHSNTQEHQSITSNKDVHLSTSGKIHIQVDSALSQKLQITTVKLQKLTAPILSVTGTVVANLRSIKGKSKPDWQFNSSELLSTHTDWQKAVADIAFAKTQLEKIKQMAETKVTAQTLLTKRLKKLVAAGTDSEKDLAAAQADLLQTQIQGSKDIHEAETALRLAQRTEAALSRQLQQAGVDPEILRVKALDSDIIVADVPEALASRVKLGQNCEAKFFSVPKKVFTGTVRAISPVLSKERRSLRVLFSIKDPEDLLRAGMFGDMGLGTDAREVLLVPMTGVVHVGHADFLLARREQEDWRVVEVQVGEVQQAAVEILSGIQAGEEVISQGAILLKPLIAEAVQKTLSSSLGGL